MELLFVVVVAAAVFYLFEYLTTTFFVAGISSFSGFELSVTHIPKQPHEIKLHLVESAFRNTPTLLYMMNKYEIIRTLDVGKSSTFCEHTFFLSFIFQRHTLYHTHIPTHYRTTNTYPYIDATVATQHAQHIFKTNLRKVIVQ